MKALRLGSVLLAVAIAATLLWHMLSDRGETEPQNPDSLAQIVIDLGRYYDWHAPQGTMGYYLRPLLTEPLLELGTNDRLIYRLIRVLEWQDGEATLQLRENAFWSDGMGLEAAHVTAGWERLRKLAATGPWTPTEEESSWLRRAQLKVVDRSTLTLSGLKDEQEVLALLSKNLLTPIRADRLQTHGDTFEAWQVTIGMYQPFTPPEGKVRLQDRFTLQPNRYYYRGPRKAPMVFEAKEALDAQSGRAVSHWRF